MAFDSVGPALAMPCSRVCRVVRAVSVANHLAKIEAVIAGNLAPASPGLVQRDNVVETLAIGVCQQMRVRHTAVGYAKNRASALVASAVTGVTTSISKGNVISPPPPASALIAPPK